MLISQEKVEHYGKGEKLKIKKICKYFLKSIKKWKAYKIWWYSNPKTEISQT